ncbi:peroxide stress protein YaaA [Actinacidiphila oryziradicis]|uniref:peroxide stress protein YaaA n=1 Tax=Actinacidiphila oryziradicis TaxID=2571141 RepID=UPI0023EFF19D|nr:peroxide stress protein YaaA [Actinacidiphila oryziradicis]MCW2869604.1 hypothetical protein [Actinacidiphila oryziradicis]
MLVLLPPSEGKATGGEGPAVDLGALSLPGLRGAREAVLEELVGLCAGDEEKAAGVLGLSAGLRGEVAKNAGLREAPTRPAGEIYTGVLYDALGLATLGAAARMRAEESLLVFSGLWGAVRVKDAIPSYRCSMGVRLPGLGGLGGYWRGPMAEVLPEAAGEGLVLDLRSAAYGSAWRPKGAVARRTATVRVLQAETRKVVSHFNKATKGRLVRALLEDAARPQDPVELAEALRDLGFVVEEQSPGKLDVLVTEVH